MLSDEEWTDVAYLLAEAREGRLPHERETKLRSILGKKDPEAFTMSWDDLVRFGRLSFGMWILTRGALGQPLPEALRAP